MLPTQTSPGDLGGHCNKAEGAQVTWRGQHAGSSALNLNSFHHTAEIPEHTQNATGVKRIIQQAEVGLNQLAALN